MWKDGQLTNNQGINYKLTYSKTLLQYQIDKKFNILLIANIGEKANHWNFLYFFLQNCLWPLPHWGIVWYHLMKSKMQFSITQWKHPYTCMYPRETLIYIHKDLVDAVDAWPMSLCLPEFTYCFCKQLLTCCQTLTCVSGSFFSGC